MNRTRAALLAFLVSVPVGCTRVAPTTDGGPGGGGGKAADPWPTAAAELRKQTDPATVRRVLNQLNADLTGTPAAAPAPLPADALKPLADQLRLDPEEVKEVSGTAFTGLDAAYLAEALYLRDAARSFDLGGAPAEEQAAAGFAWVCRQVYLRPWEMQEGQTRVFGPPVPPTAVLRRGFGTGLERAYVFLALLQQLGLDGCLVGPPGQEQAGVQKLVGDQLWKGPFWAVGVRAGGDVLLFDPWRGEPVPGPGGKGVGTLGQLKKAPDQVKAWREDKANPWDVPAGDVADAVVYAAVPLSAVTPRAKVLEAQLPGLGVRLAADPKELVGRFARGPAPAALWAPPAAAEPFAYTRVLATFLPKADGGLAANDLRLQERLDRALIPPALFPRPAGLEHPEAVLMLAREPFQAYHAALIAPGHREQIHRGHFHAASRNLVEADKVFAAAEQRSRDDAAKAEAAREWVARANEKYRRLSAARKPENRSDLPAAEAELAEFWRTEGRMAQVLTDQPLAAAGRAEAGYLLAVCKHEQAERAQLRLARAAGDGRAKARAAAEEAWAAAKDAWERYAPHAEKQAAAFPGRAEHARRLAARAAKLAGDPAAGL